jgi:hypothetical protein
LSLSIHDCDASGRGCGTVQVCGMGNEGMGQPTCLKIMD